MSFADFAKSAETFALEVSGDSMAAREGEIVVALVDGTEATLKRFHREPNGMIRLQPANSTMAPIYVHPQNLQIQGRLLAVLRKY